jgi:hypothetical protein
MPAVWAGIDAGKRAHHCVVINQAGTVSLSLRVENDENALLDLIATTAEIADGEEVSVVNAAMLRPRCCQLTCQGSHVTCHLPTNLSLVPIILATQTSQRIAN